MNSPPHTRTSRARSLRTGPCARPGAGPLLENSAVSRSSERRGEDSGFWILERPSPSIPENLSTFPGCSGGVPPASCRSAVLSDFRHSEPSLGRAGSGVGFDEPWAPTRRLPSSSPAPCGRACPAFWTRALTLCPGDARLLLQRAVSSCWLALVVRG